VCILHSQAVSPHLIPELRAKLALKGIKNGIQREPRIEPHATRSTGTDRHNLKTSLLFNEQYC